MNRFPAYPRRKHKSGQARIRIDGQDIYLGVHGSQASRERYAQLAQQFAAGIRPRPPAESMLTVTEVAARFYEDVKARKSPKEAWHYHRALKALERLYGSERADQFDDLKLETLRRAMVSGSWLTVEERAHPKAGAGWSQRVANRAIAKVRECWAWAERQRLIPRGSAAQLLLLPPLKRTDRSVRCTKPREGIDQPELDAVLPYLPAVVQGLAQVQWWAGMRPSEVIRMRVCDVEESAPDVWLYHLSRNKNDWREGREHESVVLGPEAIRVLRPWFDAARRRGPEAWIFPAVRKGQCYTVGGYAQAVASAFEGRPKLKKWTPYSLRHGAKRRITREHGLDAARAILRQSSLGTTIAYDRVRDIELATRTAKKSG